MIQIGKYSMIKSAVAGLTDCQAHDKRKLDFAFNSTFTAVNVAKIIYARNTACQLGDLMH